MLSGRPEWWTEEVARDSDSDERECRWLSDAALYLKDLYLRDPSEDDKPQEEQPEYEDFQSLRSSKVRSSRRRRHMSKVPLAKKLGKETACTGEDLFLSL
mmetsp:Transcript_27071/g.80631  ORF Transcript_27071/g.80631 Transcript_27071/m.80631 type:complete len:100 (-) Transcript_27071:21-320(-)